MCLTKRKSNSNEPYNSSKFRWKVLCNPIGSRLESSIMTHVWRVGVSHKSKHIVNRLDPDKYHDFGFHVLVNRQNAELESDSTELIAKVEVDGFLASGTWRGAQSETWRRAKVVAIYDRGGRNITAKFKPKKKK